MSLLLHTWSCTHILAIFSPFSSLGSQLCAPPMRQIIKQYHAGTVFLYESTHSHLHMQVYTYIAARVSSNKQILLGDSCRLIFSFALTPLMHQLHANLPRPNGLFPSVLLLCLHNSEQELPTILLDHGHTRENLYCNCFD